MATLRGESPRATLKGTVRLLRLPLFVTAAADSAAGYAVAWLSLRPEGRAEAPWDWGACALLAGVSTGLYLFGMVENDLVDRSRDRRFADSRAGSPCHLTDRPLATGEAGLGGAVGLLVLSAALAAACAVRLPGAAAFGAIATFALVNFYNLWAKRGQAPVAMAVMALCRMANFGIGVAAAIGVPLRVDLGMLGPTGPLWVRHGLAIAFTSAMVTGYSISVRRGYTVSTRPWQVVLLVTVFVGLGMWMVGVPAFGTRNSGVGTRDLEGGPVLVPPLARVVALVVLALLWPGRLWSGAGPQRKVAEYAPFIERALYWLLLLDAAFVADALMLEGAG